MNTIYFFATLAALLFFLSSSSGQSTQSAQSQGVGGLGSAHNFVDNLGEAELPGLGGWNGREELCRVCHVPHDHNLAQAYGNRGLLWNHAVSSATYTMYSSATLDGSIETQPTGYSKMCLGCHDGTVGIDTYGKYTGGVIMMEDYNFNAIIPGTNFAGDLQSTHPISIVYDPSLDPGLHPVSNVMGGSGTIEDILENGELVQCSSCHDVHDQPGESVFGTPLLRVNQSALTGTASGLCLTCHIK